MTANEVSIDTKKRILHVARALFAQHGFNGTSVRNIATQSEVNQAAINYHFRSKENLFWEVMKESYELADKFCADSAANSDSVEELALKVYDCFQQERDVVLNTMKMILTEGMCPGQNEEIFEEKPMGPPGVQYFAEFIKKEISFELKPEAILWGTRFIFNLIFHWALMCKPVHEGHEPSEPNCINPSEIREGVRHMIRAQMAYLKEHPGLFKAT